MDRILQKKRPNKKLDQISVLAQSISRMAAARFTLSQSIQETSKQYIGIALELDDNKQDGLANLQECYHKIAVLHSELAKIENRCAEDFRDLVERFAVIERYTAVYEAKSSAYQQASDSVIHQITALNINSKKPDGSNNVQALETSVSNAKTAKLKAQNELREAIQNLLDQKRRYNTFKTNRIKHAFMLLANARAQTARDCTDINKRIIELGGEILMLPATLVTEASPDDDEHHAVA